MKTEYTANDYMARQAAERARWTAVPAPVARAVSQRRAARKSLITRILGL